MPDIRVVDYNKEIEDTLTQAKAADIAVAFASEQGLRSGNIKHELVRFLKKGGTLKVIVDLKMANTDPDFLAELLNLHEKGFKVECRSYSPEGEGIFHPKVYIFSLKDGSVRVISGSANWTNQALTSNIEHGFVVQGTPEDEIIHASHQFFKNLWNAPNARHVDKSSLEIYRNYFRRRRGLDGKARKRSAHLWKRLQEQQATIIPELRFIWPDKDVALFLGCLAARGSIKSRQKSLSIQLRYGGSAYKHGGRKGYIGKGKVAYEASKVVHLVPEYVAKEIAKVVAPATTDIVQRGKWTYEIVVDFKKAQQLLMDLKSFFGNNVDYHSFNIPAQILKSKKELQKEFLRGYGLACGLVSDGTYDPTHHHQVWLRPSTENTGQFKHLVDLLKDQLNIPAYVHRRSTRDVAIKVPCESWLQIGFGIEWLDSIVKEGARLNKH